MSNNISTSKKRIKNKGDFVFNLVNSAIIAVLCILMVYPFVYMLSVSVSSYEQAVNVWLLPKGFQINAYKFIFKMESVKLGYMNSIIYTVSGVAVSMFLTTTMAYVMSKNYLFGKKFLNIFVLITMYFGGGLIPCYLLVTGLGFGDTIWAMIIPGALSTYNMIVMRTYFISNVPQALEEAAEIDGAGQYSILLKIYLPLSLPIIATITLFYFVASWNSWFGAQIYLSDATKYPIQLVLRNAIGSSLAQGMSNTQLQELLVNKIDANSLNYALTISTIFPILIVVPFLQKFFVKGVVVGSLKG